MERLTGKQVQTMMEALHQVYAQPEEQVENLQEEVEQLDEQGRPSGPARRAALQQRTADAAAVKSAELKAGGGQAAVDNALKARYGGRMPSQRQLARHSSGASATRSVTATGRENLYRGGGGDAAMAKGLTRQQVMAQGAKNFAAKQTTSAPTKPAAPTKPVAGGDTKPTTPAGATMPDKKPAVPTGTVNGQKFERRLPTMAELRAAQAARAAAKASGGDRAAQEKAAIKAGVDAGKPAPKLAVGAKPGTTTSYSGSTAAKPVGTAVQSGVKPVAGAPTASAAGTKFGVQRPAAQPTVQQRIQQGGTTSGARPTTNQTGTAFGTSGSLAPGANKIAAKPGAAPVVAKKEPAKRDEPLWGPGAPGYGAGKPKPKLRDEPLW